MLLLVAIPTTSAQISDRTGLKQDFTIETSGYEFTVDLISNFNIEDLEFSSEDKRLTLFINSGLENNLGELQIPINLRLEDLPVLLVTGIFGIGLSVLFIVMAIKHIGAVRTILIFSTTTLFGIFFSYVILGEEIVIPHFVAFAMVFIGIYLIRKKVAE